MATIKKAFYSAFRRCSNPSFYVMLQPYAEIIYTIFLINMQCTQYVIMTQ